MPRPMRTVATLAAGVAGLAAARARANRLTRPAAPPAAVAPQAPPRPPPPPLPPRPVPRPRSALTWVLGGLAVVGGLVVVAGFVVVGVALATRGMVEGRDTALTALAWSMGSMFVSPVVLGVAAELDDRRHERNRRADEQWRRAVGKAVADAGGSSAYVGSSSYDYATGIAIAAAGYDGGGCSGGGYDGGGYSGGADGGGGGVSSAY